MYRNRKVLLVVTLLVTLLVLWRFYLLFQRTDSCNIRESVVYLNQLCYNYTTKKLTGDLCRPLCMMDIKITKCVPHRNRPYELEAIWKGKKIILKAGKVLPFYKHYMPHITKFNLSTSSFVHYMNLTINNILGSERSRTIPWQVAAEIAHECDIGKDNMFTYEEATACWQLGTNPEYLLLKLLRDNEAMLQLYGSCGNLYGVQYVSSTPFFALSSMPWELRSEIVMGVLNMVEALEHTAFGSLYLCDIDRSNIGLIKHQNGEVVAKPYSLNLALFEKTIADHLRGKAAEGQPCSSHSQCSLKHCASKCNRMLGMCTGRLASSNLLTACQRIIMATDSSTTSLLENPPSDFEENIETIMEKCLQIGNPHIDKKLMNYFRQTLIKSN